MYDLPEFRNWMIGQLYNEYGIPIVPNDDSPRPAKPFFAYTFTSPYIPQAAPPVMEYSDVMINVPDPDEEEETIPMGFSRKRRTEYPTIVLSLTSVAATMQECYDNILKVRRWFALDGITSLKNEDVVVTRIDSVQDRSTILGETMSEYRAGFDVKFRVCSQISIDIEHIEAVAVNDAEYRPEQVEKT